MVKGSQLTQLKSALAQAGVTGRPSASKKRKRSAAPLEKEKVKRAARLEEIHQRLNPFDLKVTKLKHDVGGRKVKGAIGKPAQRKQAGIEQRKKTLLKEWEDRNRAGGIVDRRFGENDPSMNLEERMLERFTRERQKASKGAIFNLEDEDELTHYGQSLSKLDDFDNVGLGLSSEDEEDSGQIDKEIVNKTHFGGFDDDEAGDESEEPARKKSKAEVMAEVIAKSKGHKLRRQIEREQEENIRHELDSGFAALRDKLYAPGVLMAESGTIPPQEEEGITSSDPPILSLLPETQDIDYDQHVRELAFDKRSKPKDRTKTEEELALEEKEALENAEKQRRKRMLGLEDSESEHEGRKRKRGGDDLDDDFYAEEGSELGLGAGLNVKTDQDSEEASEDGEESGKESEESEEEETSEGGYEESGEDQDEEEIHDTDMFGHDQKLEHPGVVKRISATRKEAVSSVKELPYTFAAPASHEEFLEILEGVGDNEVPVVVQRIRTLYHTSLAPDNKLKLQALANIVVDHIFYVTAPPEPRFALASSLLPHLRAITQAYPVPVAQYFNDKLTNLHKNLKRGLSRGATSMEAKTWPGSSELAFLRIIGLIWSSSDLNHAVISPTRVLMGSYLGLGRIRSLSDIASGLFLCTLFLQYELLSKRFVPEAVNFLVNTFLHLAPTGYNDAALLPGLFPAPDFPLASSLSLATGVKKPVPQPGMANLVTLLTLEEPNEQAKVDLLALDLDLLAKFADMNKGIDGFIEVYDPVLDIVQRAQIKNWSDGLKSRSSRLVDMLTRLLKFARQSRQPLALQAHKPIPISSYIPKFEATTSNYLRKQDPDHERNEAAKLRYQLKQEKKGAVRELRKDAMFLAAVEQKRQLEKDKLYKERMNRVFGSIEIERAEEKAMEKAKAREERRARRK